MGYLQEEVSSGSASSQREVRRHCGLSGDDSGLPSSVDMYAALHRADSEQRTFG